jgi:hypothetical protein
MRRVSAAAASLLLFAPTACGNGASEAQAAELACQRRLAAIRPLPTGGPAGFPVTFDAVRREYEALPLDGCSEAQRAAARALASAAGRVAAAARGAGDLEQAMRRGHGGNPALLGLMAEIERFQARRSRLAEDLRKMEAAALR